jgi:hypothetical protein
MMKRILPIAFSVIVATAAMAQDIPSRGPTTGFRTPLTATKNLYVATTGSDAASNRCDVIATPCKTLQYAVNQYLSNYDGRSHVTNISVANGTYAGFVCSGVPVGTAFGGTTPAYLSVIGTNGSANVTISETGAPGAAAAAVSANNGCFVSLQGVKVQSTNNNGLFAGSGGTVQTNTDYVAGTAGSGAGKFHADFGGGIIKIAASYTSIGNAGAEAQGSLAGAIIYPESAITVTLSGTPAYSLGFVSALANSTIYINSNFVTFSGSATGKRFDLSGGAVIETIGGAAASYLPGNAAGTATGGAYYSPGTLNVGTAPIPASNATQSTPANPSGTVNTTGNGVMMGLAGSITPRTSGTILFTFTGSCANGTINDGGQVTIYVGNGAAPANGDALTGNPIGAGVLFEEAAAAKFIPCTGTSIATGQALNTAMWYDVALVARTGGTASISQVIMTATEL